MNRNEMEEYIVKRLRERKNSPYASIQSEQIHAVLDLINLIVNGEANEEQEFTVSRFMIMVNGEPTGQAADTVEELKKLKSEIGAAIYDNATQEIVSYFDGDNWL